MKRKTPRTPQQRKRKPYKRPVVHFEKYTIEDQQAVFQQSSYCNGGPDCPGGPGGSVC